MTAYSAFQALLLHRPAMGAAGWAWLQQLKGMRPPTRAVRDAAREAAEVREMALRHLASDPGFAADLFAAADRHEQIGLTGRGA